MMSLATARVAPEKAVLRPALLSLPIAGVLPEKKMSEYTAKLKDPRWQRKRLEIMGRDKFKCRLCGDSDSTLHVHHIKYERGADPWDYNDESLVTLCEGCHEELHIVKFGESIIEACIAGGANLLALHDLMNEFLGQFTDGPWQAPLPTERWPDAVSGLGYAFDAARRGASKDEIREALDKIKPNKK
jgi:hypothetical protein